MEFDGEQERSDEDAMHIVPIEGELALGHVVAVDVHDGDDEAVGGVVGVLVQPAQVGLQGDGWHLLRIEHGLALLRLVLDQVAQQLLRQQDELVQLGFLLGQARRTLL